MKLTIVKKGGPGSGDHGHQGRPGKVGGSSGGGKFTGTTRYEEWARANGQSPKHRSGKLTGTRFSYNGHKYEIIQSIPLMHDKGLVKHYGEPVAFLHTFDHTAQQEVSITLRQSGKADIGRLGGASSVEDFPIKHTQT